MEMIQAAIYANAFRKQLEDSTQAPCRTSGRGEWEPGPVWRLRELVRLAAATGAVAAFLGAIRHATH